MQKSTEPCLGKVQKRPKPCLGNVLIFEKRTTEVQKSPKPCLGGVIVHETDCNNVDDPSRWDVGCQKLARLVIGRHWWDAAMSLLPTERVCGSVGGLVWKRCSMEEEEIAFT